MLNRKSLNFDHRLNVEKDGFVDDDWESCWCVETIPPGILDNSTIRLDHMLQCGSCCRWWTCSVPWDCSVVDDILYNSWSAHSVARNTCCCFSCQLQPFRNHWPMVITKQSRLRAWCHCFFWPRSTSDAEEAADSASSALDLLEMEMGPHIRWSYAASSHW